MLSQGVWGEEGGGGGEEGEDDALAAERAQSVLMATYPRSLLAELRASAGTLLSLATACGHILGPQGLGTQPKTQGTPHPFSSPLGAVAVPATQYPADGPGSQTPFCSQPPQGTPLTLQTPGQVSTQNLGPEIEELEVLGIRAALRLWMGAHAGLRHAALSALCAHLQLPAPPDAQPPTSLPAAGAPAAAGSTATPPVSAGDWGVTARSMQHSARSMLGALLSRGGAHAACVVECVGSAVDELAAHPSAQLLTHPLLEPVMFSLAMLLQAAEWCVEGGDGIADMGEEGEVLAHQLRVLCAKGAGLAHAVLGAAQPHALRVAAAAPGHAPGLTSSLQLVFSVASGSWLYLLAPVVDAGTVGFGAAGVVGQTSGSAKHGAPAAAAANHNPHQQLPRALAACVVQLLGWGAACLTTAVHCMGGLHTTSSSSTARSARDAPDAVAESWGDAADALLIQLREFGGPGGTLPERVLAAVRAALASGSALTNAARNRLAALVPEAAPPALRLVAQKSSLAGLPSHKSAQPTQQQGQQPQAAPQAAAGAAEAGGQGGAGAGQHAQQAQHAQQPQQHEGAMTSPSGRLRQTQLRDAFAGGVRTGANARSSRQLNGPRPAAVCIDLTGDDDSEEEEHGDDRQGAAAAARYGPAAAAAAAAVARQQAQPPQSMQQGGGGVGAVPGGATAAAATAAAGGKAAHKAPSVAVRRKLAAAAAVAVAAATGAAATGPGAARRPEAHADVAGQDQGPEGVGEGRQGVGKGGRKSDEVGTRSVVDAWLAREAHVEDDRDDMTLAQQLQLRCVGNLMACHQVLRQVCLLPFSRSFAWGCSVRLCSMSSNFNTTLQHKAFCTLKAHKLTQLSILEPVACQHAANRQASDAPSSTRAHSINSLFAETLRSHFHPQAARTPHRPPQP